ncbi:hypothetical protein [Streptomyces sp. NPDC055681]
MNAALSSGSRQYRRLNRAGDRQVNAARHRIVQTRLRCDPRTQEYCEGRASPTTADSRPRTDWRAPWSCGPLPATHRGLS